MKQPNDIEVVAGILREQVLEDRLMQMAITEAALTLALTKPDTLVVKSPRPPGLHSEFGRRHMKR